ncbi:permease-like cell division protein FtsX [Actinomadura nitritigenes]|uniref:permease-like cell division protein FtsX n=1 Tax=Actinomadura nitritigenes TaxID=134602 RepID=UPI003D8F2E98
MNATEERLRDALAAAGGVIGPEDVPPPRFTERARRASFSRPVLVAASAVAVAGAVAAAGAAAGGLLSDGRPKVHPLAATSAGPTGSAPAGTGQLEILLCTRSQAKAPCDGREVTETQKTSLTVLLQRDRRVRHTEFVSKQEAYERYKEQLEAFKEHRRSTPPVAFTQAGDVPQEFIVTIARTDAVAVAQGLLGRPGVQRIILPRH